MSAVILSDLSYPVSTGALNHAWNDVDYVAFCKLNKITIWKDLQTVNFISEMVNHEDT